MLGSGACSYHPQRAGIGICVECRKVICIECTTQFEGINRCAQCLQKRLNKAATVRPRREWGAGNLLLAMFSLAVIYGFIQLAVVLARR